MEKDQAIRNQKVFIRLDHLTAVQNEYHRVREKTEPTAMTLYRANNDSLTPISEMARRRAFEFVLDTLQLPREGN